MTRFKLGQLPPEPDPKAKLLKNYLDRKAITPPATEPIDMSKLRGEVRLCDDCHDG